MSRGTTVIGAGALALLVVGVTASPGAAATTGHAEATALRVTVAGESAGSNSYVADNAGDGEQTRGVNQPAAPPLLAQQGALSVGTLFQDAAARGDGSTAACAGLAGDGATIVQVGQGTSCFTGADNARLTLAELDPGALTAELPPELTDALGPLTDEVEAQLGQALEQAPAGGLYLDLTGIEGRCDAQPPAGDALFAGVALRGGVGGEDLTLLDLQNRYAPNTELPVDLAQVYDQLLADVEQALTTGLGGQTGPLAQLPAALRDQAIQSALDQVGTQLQPLRDQALRLTLNKQHREGRSITVTALDLELLPAAEAQVGGKPLHLELGQAVCSASHRADPKPEPEPEPKEELPAYPTSVPAGGSGGDDGLPLGGAILALVGALTAAGALLGRRTSD